MSLHNPHSEGTRSSTSRIDQLSRRRCDGAVDNSSYNPALEIWRSSSSPQVPECRARPSTTLVPSPRRCWQGRSPRPSRECADVDIEKPVRSTCPSRELMQKKRPHDERVRLTSEVRPAAASRSAFPSDWRPRAARSNARRASRRQEYPSPGSCRAGSHSVHVYEVIVFRCRASAAWIRSHQARGRKALIAARGPRTPHLHHGLRPARDSRGSQRAERP